MFLSCRWINHSRIMTNKAPVMPPMPPDVRFRRATPRDQADIIALGATIQELDYMDYMYPFYISHPEYFSFCLEKEGQLICFAIMHVVDGGDTLVRFAGRTHATLRGKGYMEMLLAAADYFVCQHLTTAPFRRIYLSRAAAFQRELVKKSPAKFNVILSRQVLGRKTTKGEVSAIVASEDFQNSQNKYSTEVWVPTDEEIVALLSDQSTKQRLFPDDNFIAMFEPYRPTVANMTQARRTSKIFLSGIRRAASVRALSFVSEIAVHTGLRYDIYIYGREGNDILHHLYNSLKNLSTLPLLANVVTEIGVYLPMYVDRNVVEKQLDRYGWELGALCNNPELVLIERVDFRNKL